MAHYRIYARLYLTFHSSPAQYFKRNILSFENLKNTEKYIDEKKGNCYDLKHSYPLGIHSFGKAGSVSHCFCTLLELNSG